MIVDALWRDGGEFTWSVAGSIAKPDRTVRRSGFLPEGGADVKETAVGSPDKLAGPADGADPARHAKAAVESLGSAEKALGSAAESLRQLVEEASGAKPPSPEHKWRVGQHERRVRLVVLQEEAMDVRRRVRALTDE